MTIYPDWAKVSCPVCNAKPYELCSAVMTLPKGITLRHPHNGRLVAYEQTKQDKEIRDSGQDISSGNDSNKTQSNRTT